MQTHLTHAKVHFTKTGEEGKQLQASVASLTSMSEVQSARKEAAEHSKHITGGDCKLFFSKCASATRFIEKTRRASASDAADPAASIGGGEIVVSLSYTKVAAIRDELGAGGSHNLGSLFESKAGLRAAHVHPNSGTDPVGGISALPATKKSVKDMKQDLQANSWGVFAVVDPKKDPGFRRS